MTTDNERKNDFKLNIHNLHPLVKNPPVNAGDTKDVGSIPGLGRLPGGGHGNPLQYSCPENSMDRGAWQGHKESDRIE